MKVPLSSTHESSYVPLEINKKISSDTHAKKNNINFNPRKDCLNSISIFKSDYTYKELED